MRRTIMRVKSSMTQSQDQNVKPEGLDDATDAGGTQAPAKVTGTKALATESTAKGVGRAVSACMTARDHG